MDFGEKLQEYFKNYKQNYVIVTNDEEVNLEGPTVNYDPDILKIVLTVKDRQEINPHAVEPNYLKLTEAEEKLND